MNLVMLTIKAIWGTYIRKMKLPQANGNHVVTKTLKHINRP